MPFDARQGGSESTKHNEINDIVGWTTSIQVAGELRKDTLNRAPRWKLSRATVPIDKQDTLVEVFKETSMWGEWRTFNYNTTNPIEAKGYTESSMYDLMQLQSLANVMTVHLVWANLSHDTLTVRIGIEE